MTTAAQIDYDALAEQARKQAAPAPKKSAQAAVDYDALAAQARQAPAAPAADFTTNSIDPATGKGYGLYDMVGPAGLAKVPFDKYQSAIIAGYTPARGVAAKYRDDLAATQPSWFQRVTTPTLPNPNTTPIDSSWGANKDAAWNAAANAMGVGGNIVKRAARTVEGAVEFPFHVAGTVSNLSSSDPETSARAEDALLAMHPATQIYDRFKELGQDWKQSPALAGENVVGDALGMYLTGKLAEGALKAPKTVGDIAESGIRRLAGSGPGVASKLAREAAEDNRVIDLHNADKQAEAQQKWRDAQAKATADHQAELLRLRQKYAQDTRNATEKARTGTAEDRAQYQAKQLASKQKYEQDVRDQTAKFQAERAKAIQENADAQREYNQKIGKTAQHNREATAAERAQAQQAARLQVGGSQLIYGLRQLDKTLRAKANDLYGAVREKMDGATLPSDTLADGVKAAQAEWIRGSPAKVAEFNAMVSPGQPGPELVLADQTAQNMGYKDFRTAISNPDIRSTLSRALPPDVWQAAIGQGTRPISWNDLQGFYEETGAKISEGPQPGKGDIFKALQQVHKFVGDQMQQLADTRDVGDQFRAARKFYREYMDAFHEPTGPSSSGSPVAQALLAKDPEVAARIFASPSGMRGITDLRRYSPSLASLAQDVRQTAQTDIRVPTRKSAVDIPQPKAKPVPGGANLPLPPIQESEPAPRAAQLPLPPVLPEPETVPFREPKLAPRRTISAGDLQRANEAAVRARAAGLAGHLFWWTGVWPAFRMLSELSKGAEVSLKPLALMPAAGAAGMATEELMGQPAVMEFLTRASRQQVARIPPDLRGQMPDVVSLAEKRGIKVSPILAAYAAAIQNNRGNQPARQGSQQ